jgi:hypothetical protein
LIERHGERGEVSVNLQPGLGLELLPGLERRPDAILRRTVS